MSVVPEIIQTSLASLTALSPRYALLVASYIDELRSRIRLLEARELDRAEKPKAQ